MLLLDAERETAERGDASTDGTADDATDAVAEFSFLSFPFCFLLDVDTAGIGGTSTGGGISPAILSKTGGGSSATEILDLRRDRFAGGGSGDGSRGGGGGAVACDAKLAEESRDRRFIIIIIYYNKNNYNKYIQN
jgi:hypothetical protein